MFDTKPYDSSADSPTFPSRSRTLVVVDPPPSGPLTLPRRAFSLPTGEEGEGEEDGVPEGGAIATAAASPPPSTSTSTPPGAAATAAAAGWRDAASSSSSSSSDAIESAGGPTPSPDPSLRPPAARLPPSRGGKVPGRRRRRGGAELDDDVGVVVVGRIRLGATADATDAGGAKPSADRVAMTASDTTTAAAYVARRARVIVILGFN